MIIQSQNYGIHVLDEHYSGPLDLNDDNVDVVVELNTGERYVATFFTLDNIRSLMERYRETGECSSGKYFWASDTIIVENLTEEVIRQTVESLMSTDEFEQAFSGPITD